MLIRDSAKAVARGKTREGFLHVRAKIGRVGIHAYKARDLGHPAGLAPDDLVRVYRPPEQVFDPVSMASFAGVPVTQDHPPTMVDASNWKRFAVGHAGASVQRDGDHIATDLLITDADAVARAEQGAELSNGYWADFVFGKGLSPEGEAYDAVQSNIRGNHIALVDQGRCGPSCRIDPTAADGRTRDCAVDGPCGCTQDPEGDATMSDRKTVTIDGITVETTPEGVLALGRIEALLEESRAAHRREVEARAGEIAALRARLPDAAALDGLVAERALVIDAARQVLGSAFDTAGKSLPVIRRAAVTKLLGSERIANRGDDYVAAAFDVLVAAGLPAAGPPAAGSALAAHVAAGLSDGQASRDSAVAARNTYLNQAWKGQSSGAL